MYVKREGLGPSINRFNPAMYVKREGLGPSNRFNPAMYIKREGLGPPSIGLTPPCM